MADEQRQPRQNAQQGNAQATGQGQNQQPQQPLENVAEQEDVEEVQSELEEAENELEEKLDRMEDSGEDEDRGDFIGEQTIIHVAQHVAYEHYGERDPTADNDKEYLDPIDIFFIVKPYMHYRFGEKFRKLIELKHGEGIPLVSRIIGPLASRLNSRLLHYEYYYAIKGIERARSEGQISLKVSDRMKYNLMIKTPPFGPPLAFYRRGYWKKKQEWAEKVAGRLVGHGVTEKEVEAKVEVGTVQRRVQNLIQESKYYQQKIKTAKSHAEKERFREKLQETKEKLNMAKQELRRAKKQRS